MSPESVLHLIPGLSFTRETDGFHIFEDGDLFVSFVNDCLFGFSIYVRGEVPTLPNQIGPWTFPITKAAFLRFLEENGAATSPHLDLLGNEIGIQLVSGVVVLFDGRYVFSIRTSIS